MTGGSTIDNINFPQENKTVSLPSTKDTILLEWTGLTFNKTEKDTRWYLFFGILIFGIVGFAAWQRDWFIIGITLIVSIVLFWYDKTVHPQEVFYQLTPLGLSVNEKIYPFSEIHSFWIVYNEQVQKLHIAFIKKYLPTLDVDIEKIDPIILRTVLLKKIPEQEKRGESLIDRFTRLAGF